MIRASLRPHHVLVACVWSVILVAFSWGAFRVDEPNIIAIGEQIAREPLNPYGFRINWTGTPRDAFDVLANPILIPLWLAGWGSLFGWSEIVLHLSMIPFSVAVIYGVRRLAAHFDISPESAGWLLFASPAFVLGSLVVMPDVAMLAFFVWSIALVLDYAVKPSRRLAIAAAACAALAPMTKYNGLILLPLLALIALLCPRAWRAALFALLIAFLTLFAWNAFTELTYGRSHFFTIAEFERHFDPALLTGALAAVGLGVMPLVLFLVPQDLPVRSSFVALVLVVSGAGAMAIGLLQFDYALVPAILFGVAIAAAVRLLLVLVFRLARLSWPLEWRNWILGAWILGTIAFQFRLLFSSVRYMLPLLVPVILLLLMHARATDRGRKFAQLLAVNIVFVLAVAIGDVAVANTYRTFVRQHRDVVRSARTAYFDGHWGFQRYMELEGGSIVSARSAPPYRAGDVLVVATNPFPSTFEPKLQSGLTASREVHWLSPSWPIRTIECRTAANFYGNAIGPCKYWGTAYLPFGFSLLPSERFDIFTIREAAAKPGEATRRLEGPR